MQQKAPKKFPCYKRYKNSRNFLDEKAKCQPWIIKKKPKLDENIILHIMWMNVEMFCFTVIFYVCSQLNFTENMKKNPAYKYSIR
jgi:hypothetical protein